MPKRVIKNGGRVGKPWLIVEGHWEKSSGFIRPGDRWVTTFQISEHNTKPEAAAAFADLVMKEAKGT